MTPTPLLTLHLSPFLTALDDLDTSSLVAYLALLSAVLRDKSPRMAQTVPIEEEDGDENEDEVVPVLTGALVGGVLASWLHEH